MNERIKELAEQATIIEYGVDNGSDRISFDKEKFAELIVKECAELTINYRTDDYYNGWLDYRDEIKKHFGVEE